jgi:CheY-like chemotaxis protein
MSAARVLVAEDEQVCSLVVQRLMTKAGYEVTVVRDGQAAITELETNEYSAALVDWMLPVLDGIEIVRRVAAMKNPKKPRTILTSVIDIPAAREYAIAAGAVDFLAKPVAPAKLLQLLKETCGTANDVAVTKPETSHPLVRSNAWLELGARSVSPLGDLLGVPVSAESMTTTANADGAICLAAALVDPARACEVFTSVIAVPDSALEIGKTMLGEANEEEAADAVSEVVNVVAGVVKAAFVADGFSFTLSLPGRFSPADFHKRQAAALATASVNLILNGKKFILSYLVTSTSVVEIPAEELHEGYVLAEDLRRNGALLLPICTRLTEGAARRIRETCKGTKVKVCPPMRG